MPEAGYTQPRTHTPTYSQTSTNLKKDRGETMKTMDSCNWGIKGKQAVRQHQERDGT